MNEEKDYTDYLNDFDILDTLSDEQVKRLINTNGLNLQQVVELFQVAKDFSHTRHNEGRSAYAKGSAEKFIVRYGRKRVIDIVFASAALIFFAPLIILIYILVRLDGGPAFIAKDRIGKDGRLFRCYKFRTMVPNADVMPGYLLENDWERRSERGYDQKLGDDPRITPIGRFLRQRTLDELPQIWNVLCGDMGVVGPRPIAEDAVKEYGDGFRYYVAIRPGLTGAWQVASGSGESYLERAAFDFEYVANWSWKRDVGIMAKTFIYPFLKIITSDRVTCDY